MARFVATETGFTVLESGEVLHVEAWGSSGARVRSTIGAAISETPGSALCEAAATDVVVEVTSGRATLRNGDLVVEVYENEEDRFTWFPPLVRFSRADGTVLLSERVPHFTPRDSVVTARRAATSSSAKSCSMPIRTSASTGSVSISTACWIRRAP